MIAAISRLLQPLRRDSRGAMAAQLSLTLPLWIMLIFSVFNISRFYWARAGLQNGLGEAARTATLWPLRTNAVLRTAFEDTMFGITSSEKPTLTFVTGTSNGQNFIDIRVVYNPKFYLLFIGVQPVTLTYSRRAFRPPS